MKTVQIQGLTVQGWRVRTCNADERQASTARIGPLWAQFAKQIAPHMAPGAQAYGVYHRYESDAEGAYEVLVGVDGVRPQTGDSNAVARVDIAPGLYVVFDASGPLPQAVVDAWARIWRYFADPACPHRRAYTTDFESYGADGKVDIFVAVFSSGAGCSFDGA